MKRDLVGAVLATAVVGLFLITPQTLNAVERDILLPAGTLLQCSLNEPNFSSATVEVGDPVLCQLYGRSEFGQQSLPRGSYLAGHLEAAKNPGHFVGKGYLKLQFDRIGVPSGDLPVQAKLIAATGYHVDREGKIKGKGHAKRDVAEWMFPPLWPWKVIMLPARGPRPKLKPESTLTLRLMADVDIPQIAQTFGPGWHFFAAPQNESYSGRPLDTPSRSALPAVASDPTFGPQPSYATTNGPVATYSTMEVTPDSMTPVFILKSGAALSVTGYAYHDRLITFSTPGGSVGAISTDDIDWDSTMRVNSRRGVRVTLHPATSAGSHF